MPKIYAIGETIYDIIFKGGEPVAARAGGAMLNSCVSLGRLGMDVNFISEIACDEAGENIIRFLASNGVNTALAYRYNGKTIIALAFLQDNNDARYSFYKTVPALRLQIDPPAFAAGDILLFGAFYSLMDGIRDQLLALLRSARKAGALTIYDPNIRSPHKEEIGRLRDRIYENFRLADIVRASDEDFQTMFDIENGSDAYALVRSHQCDHLLYTKSDTGVEIHTVEGMRELAVPKIETLSTIGAGDSFNAGLMYELLHMGHDINGDRLEACAGTAIRFGSHVCTHYENYISEGFARAELKR